MERFARFFCRSRVLVEIGVERCVYIYILESACALRAHLILLLAAQDQDRHFMAVYVLPMMVSVAT